MTKWIILGAGGMLGQEFMNLPPANNFIGFTRETCDITSVTELREKLVDADVVINCAAWTAVDEAESREADAFELNAVGAENVAKVCAEFKAKLVHFSTDYVFPGDAASPYRENEITGPKSAYGRTKLAGELAVLKNHPNGSYVVRTAWLYGRYGPNFVKTMISLERQKETISVVDDQFGQPTWTYNLVNKTVELVEKNSKFGIYHGTSSGQTTWFEFAQHIFSLIGANPDRVLPVTSEMFLRPAARPSYSVLDHENWKNAGIQPIKNWDKALVDAFNSGAFADA